MKSLAIAIIAVVLFAGFFAGTVAKQAAEQYLARIAQIAGE